MLHVIKPPSHISTGDDFRRKCHRKLLDKDLPKLKKILMEHADGSQCGGETVELTRIKALECSLTQSKERDNHLQEYRRKCMFSEKIKD